MKNKNEWMSFAVVSAIVVIGFHLIYGLSILIPTNINWLMQEHGDWGTYYLGWAFYRVEPWSFPLGYMDNYGYPIAHNVALTDGVPFLPILLKPFSYFLPSAFQVYGVWLLLCYLLTGYFSLKIFSFFKLSRALSIIGAILIALNPVIISRGMHIPLSAHWVLLASIYLYLIPTDQSNVWRVNKYQLLLLLLTSVINIYLTLMIAGLSLVIALKHKIFDKSIDFKQSIIIPAFSALLVLLMWVLVGIISFHGTVSQLSLSFGSYSTNLNSFFNSFGLSSFLPALKIISSDQGEGFAYFGLGFLVLLFIDLTYYAFKHSHLKFEEIKSFKFSLPAFIALLAFAQGLPVLGTGLMIWLLGSVLLRSKVPALPNLSKYLYLAPLGILSILFLLFAYSNTVTFADHELFKIPLPLIVEKAAGMFRGCGRFVWLFYYLSALSGIVLFSRIPLIGSSQTILFSIVAVIQITDIIPCFKIYNSTKGAAVGDYKTPLKDANWISLMSNFDAIVTFPPFEKTNFYKMDYQDLAFLALNAGKPISTAYYSRNTNEENNKFLEQVARQIMEQNLDKEYLFVTTQKHINTFKNLIQSGKYDIQKLDHYYCVFLNKKGKINSDLFDADPKVAAELELLKNTPDFPYFPAGNFTYHDLIVAPIWGAGWVSTLPYKIKKGKHILKFNSTGTPAQGEFPVVEVAINDRVVGQFTVNAEIKDYEIPFETPDDIKAVISVRLKNDFATNTEDRNAFVRWVMVFPLK